MMYIKWHEYNESNWRLRDEPVELRCTHDRVLEAPGSDRWDDDGGACAPLPEETTLRELHAQRIRVRGPRKQRSARIVRKIESITVVSEKKIQKREDVLDTLFTEKIQDALAEANTMTLAVAKAKLEREEFPKTRTTSPIGELQLLKKQMLELQALIRSRK